MVYRERIPVSNGFHGEAGFGYVRQRTGEGTHWPAGGEVRAAGENSYSVGLSTESGLANLWSGFGSCRGEGIGAPEEENRKARAEADDERGLRLMGGPVGDVTEADSGAAEPEAEEL